MKPQISYMCGYVLTNITIVFYTFMHTFGMRFEIWCRIKFLLNKNYTDISFFYVEIEYGIEDYPVVLLP